MTRYDGIDIPNEAFEEEGMIDRPKPKGKRAILFWVTGFVLLVIFVLSLVLGYRF